MRHSQRFVMVLLPALALASACSTSTGSGSSASSAATTTVQTSSSPMTSSETTSSTAGAPGTTVDACQVVTRAEASALSGHQLSAGKAEDTTGGSRCTYGAQTTTVFWVQVAQASSAAEASAAWSQQQAQAQTLINKQLPAGISSTLKYQPLSGVGDRAETGSWSASLGGQTMRLSAIYVLKGATFLTFGEAALGTVPTVQALKSQAQTSLTRLP